VKIWDPLFASSSSFHSDEFSGDTRHLYWPSNDLQTKVRLLQESDVISIAISLTTHQFVHSILIHHREPFKAPYSSLPYLNLLWFPTTTTTIASVSQCCLSYLLPTNYYNTTPFNIWVYNYITVQPRRRSKCVVLLGSFRLHLSHRHTRQSRQPAYKHITLDYSAAFLKLFAFLGIFCPPTTHTTRQSLKPWAQPHHSQSQAPSSFRSFDRSVNGIPVEVQNLGTYNNITLSHKRRLS
jgi:hypothetical protein